MTDINPDNVIPETELARRRFVHETTDKMSDTLGFMVSAYRSLYDAGVPTRDWLPLVCDHLPEPYRTKMLQGAETYGVAVIDGFAGFLRDGTAGFLEAAMPLLTGLAFKGERTPPLPPLSKRARLPPVPGGQRGEDEDDDDFDPNEDTSGVDDNITAARMRITIRRLFETAPRMTSPDGAPDPSQAPALPCHVVLRGSSLPPIEGVLSTTPEGGLRFLSPVEIEDKDAPAPSHPRAPRPTKTVLCEQFFDYCDVVTVMIQRDIKATPGSGLIS